MGQLPPMVVRETALENIMRLLLACLAQLKRAGSLLIGGIVLIASLGLGSGHMGTWHVGQNAKQVTAQPAIAPLILAADSPNAYNTTSDPPVMPEVTPPSVENTTVDELKFNRKETPEEEIEQTLQDKPETKTAEVEELSKDMQPHVRDNRDVQEYLDQEFDYDTDDQVRR